MKSWRPAGAPVPGGLLLQGYALARSQAGRRARGSGARRGWPAVGDCAQSGRQPARPLRLRGLVEIILAPTCTTSIVGIIFVKVVFCAPVVAVVILCLCLNPFPRLLPVDVDLVLAGLAIGRVWGSAR